MPDYFPPDLREEGFGRRQEPHVCTLKSLNNPHTKEVAQTPGYSIHANSETGELYIQTTEYHAGVLVITQEGLEKLLSKLKPARS